MNEKRKERDQERKTGKEAKEKGIEDLLVSLKRFKRNICYVLRGL